MAGATSRLLKAAAAPASCFFRALRPAAVPSPPLARSAPSRHVHEHTASKHENPVITQMINYALSHARSKKSDESYAQGMLVLEQCLNTQTGDKENGSRSTRAVVSLAMSTLLYERGNFDEAIDRLRKIECIKDSTLGVRVTAMEALMGLHLEQGQDDASSVVADKCLELVKREAADGSNSDYLVINARAKAAKGLVELLRGNVESAESYFQGSDGDRYSTGSAALINGNAALSYGEFLHSTRNFSLAKEVYNKVVHGTSENTESSEHTVAACNMSSEEVMVAATCALGQLNAHLGHFNDAEETLTKALTKAEEYYGSDHPKVGVVLTCIALMYRWKAMKERSSSLLVQEGLLRKAIELLKAPPVEGGGDGGSLKRRDIVALARGAYAETLCIQQNRKSEGEKLKRWAESVWRNRRMLLSEALDWSESSFKMPIVDCRIGRVL